MGDTHAAGRVRRSRRTLSRETIVDAALRVLDEGGLEAMTMRRVAEELDTGAASFYAHIDSKEALIEAVMDRIIGELPLPPAPDPERWQEQTKDIVRGMRAVFAPHRDAAKAALARIPTGENALIRMEGMIAILRAGRVADQAIAWACDILSLYATATAYEESLMDWQEATEDDVAAFVADLRGYFSALPADRYPLTSALAIPLTSGEGDDRFEFGLDLMVRGLESHVEPAPG